MNCNTLLNYEEFKREIINNVGGHERVVESTVVKPGDKVLDALTLRDKGERPVVYVDALYEMYLGGKTIGYVSNEARRLLETPPSKSITEYVEKFSKYDEIKSTILFKVINFESNKKYLKDAIYVKRLDLALVFYVQVSQDEKQSATITIRDSHLRIWNKTAEDIYLQAMINIRKEEHVCMSIQQALGDLLDDESIKDEACVGNNRMFYVLSNKSRTLGAAMLFKPGVLDACSEEIADGGDLIIIPSSVHEILILPYRFKDISQIRQIVREVNETQVADEEVLSNNVYGYCKQTKRVSIL